MECRIIYALLTDANERENEGYRRGNLTSAWPVSKGIRHLNGRYAEWAAGSSWPDRDLAKTLANVWNAQKAARCAQNVA